MRLKTLLKRPAITTEEPIPVAVAWNLMRRHGIGHLPVLRKRALVGMLAERDVQAAGLSSARELRAHDLPDVVAGLTVRDAMTRAPIALASDTPVAEAARLAREHRVDALVVMDSGEVTGVVRSADLLSVLSGLLEPRQPTGFGHILVATSLGARSGGALAEAIRLAVVAGASVTPVHVQPRVGWLAGVEGADAEPVAWVERARRRLESDVGVALARLGRGAEVTCEVAEGPVAREIARRAAELDSDLIVVGRSMPRGPLAALERTVADRLVRLAPCPVLAVPVDARRGHEGR